MMVHIHCTILLKHRAMLYISIERNYLRNVRYKISIVRYSKSSVNVRNALYDNIGEPYDLRYVSNDAFEAQNDVSYLSDDTI